METGEDRYNKILKVLRNAKPEMIRQEELTDKVMKRLASRERSNDMTGEFFDSLFAWVYIPWVRRSLLTVAVMLVALFIYQQSVLVKQVRDINRQAIVIRSDIRTSPAADFGTKLKLYRASGLILSRQNFSIDQKDLLQILDEYNDVKGKYSDLLKIIDENPELKEYVEKKLDERKNSRPEI
jgi:hypothetical protein